jgi:hypothetical protein
MIDAASVTVHEFIFMLPASPFVMPAEAGIQRSSWVPAFATLSRGRRI